MAVSLSGLPGILPFHAVGEQQHWHRDEKWRDEFKLFVTASGVAADKQRRALFLHLAGPGVPEVFKTFPPDPMGDEKDYKKAMETLSGQFKLRKNVPMARQTTARRDGTEADNQVRDQTLMFINDKSLKSKLHRKDDFTLVGL